MRSLPAALFLLSSVTVAQESPPAATVLPADLVALAQRVEAAHRPNGPTEPFTAFAGSLALQLVAADAAQRGEAELSVRFLQTQRDGSDKPRSLLRIRLVDSSRPVERGRDRYGFWALIDGQVRDVPGKDTAADEAACKRDLGLARQMLRFLDAAAVLRSLQSPAPVRQAPLQLGREPAVDCAIAEGRLPAFPLQQTAGEDGPVQARIFVEQKTGRLFAVEVWPLDAQGNRIDGPGELIRLRDLRLQDDVLLPNRLDHYLLRPGGAPSLQFKVILTAMQLRPKLLPQDFERPKQ